ncbi:MAG: hypothetical protein IK079_01005 [Desulfovibrio sp.]|nr:hypothetical protein [Desulfovibrio sp.]
MPLANLTLHSTMFCKVQVIPAVFRSTCANLKQDIFDLVIVLLPFLGTLSA